MPLSDTPAVARRQALAAGAAFAAVPQWTHEPLKAALEEVGAERGLKLGKTQAPVRVATTGRSVGLPLFESLEGAYARPDRGRPGNPYLIVTRSRQL
jgi:glutamyl/glutaminyl-tRNA synthetase